MSFAQPHQQRSWAVCELYEHIRLSHGSFALICKDLQEMQLLP